MDQQAFEGAVRQYWLVRQSQAAKQRDAGRSDTGTRGQATGGGHLDAVTELLANVFIDAGFERSSVRVNTGIELPGFYRPTKKWDLVVIERGRLVAAIELKSQAGPSFGNNFNNRIEEALGSAVDVWAAYEKGAFGGLRPWLGYLFLLEESPRSTSPVRVANTVFPTDPIFENTSYRDRYLILCKRLVRERLYDAACFVTAREDPAAPIEQPDPEVSFPHFVAAILGRAAYVKSLHP